MPSPRPSLVSTRPRSSVVVGRGGIWRPWNSPHLSGWTGSIPGDCSSHSAMCPRPSTRRSTIGRRTLPPQWPESTNELSGKPGTVQPWNSRPWPGSTGSTRGGCSSQSATCRRRSTKRSNINRPQWPESTNSLSQIPGTVHPADSEGSWYSPLCRRPVESECPHGHFIRLFGLGRRTSDTFWY